MALSRTLPVLALLLPLLGVAPAPAPAAAGPGPLPPPARAGAEVVRHTVTSEGERYRLRLEPVGLRAPQFGVFVQQPDGSLDRVEVARTRAYLGSVEGITSSSAVAVRRRDGTLAGQIAIDGRETLFFTQERVTGTDGTDRPAYHWPSSDEAADNVTVRPGQVEGFTRRWDLGFDLDHSYLQELGGSRAAALDAIELTTVELLATYESNARLRPAIGRVVLRSAQAASPYAGREAELGEVREQWVRPLQRDVVDAAAYLHSDGDGGGVAYVDTIGGDYAVSKNGGGNSIFVIRHELGHNWGPGDNHTNGPEGQTIMSGNDYARFDGTELAAILRGRDDRLASEPGRFPRVRTSSIPLAPYAALDLRDRVRSGALLRLRPLLNDIDANGDRLTLRSVAIRSHLGVRLERRGDVVVYRAPRVGAPRTLDWVRYTAVDATGRTASGVMMIRVSPAA